MPIDPQHHYFIVIDYKKIEIVIAFLDNLHTQNLMFATLIINFILLGSNSYQTYKSALTLILILELYNT